MTSEDSTRGRSPSFDGGFATTHWSVVIQAGCLDSPDALPALEKLCQAYWYPLYAFVRRSGYGIEDAQDLTQDFFARLIATEHWAAVHSAKGRFRWFLLTAIKRLLILNSPHPATFLRELRESIAHGAGAATRSRAVGAIDDLHLL